MQSNNVSPLLPLNLTAPGAAGLTAETSIAGDFQEWLFEANNAVYNAEGLLSPRQLFRIPRPNYWGAFPTLSEYYPVPVADKYFIGGVGKLYDQADGTDLSTLANDGTVPGTWTLNREWQATYLNGKYYFFAESVAPKVYDPTVPAFSGITGAPLFGIIHSAFGRLWASSEQSAITTLQWSLLLNGKNWTGAGTGSINLSSYMSSNEAITAITDFNGYLIVFTNKSIFIYQDPFLVPVDNSGTGGTPQTMTLKEHIKGTGCVGKFAWCHVGEELLFMSQNGLKSLSRVLAEGGAAPLKNICPQVTTQVIDSIKYQVGLSFNLTQVRLAYHPTMGFVTVETGSSISGVFLLWINRPISEGAYPVTRWGLLQSDVDDNNVAGISLYGLHSTGSFDGRGPGITAIGVVLDNTPTVTYKGPVHYGMYDLYTKDELEAETSFKMTIKSAWLNFGDAQGPAVKIPKDMKLIYRTTQSPYPAGDPSGFTPTALTLGFKLRFDYSETPRNHSFTTPLVVQSEFNVSQQFAPHKITPLPLSGDGSLVQWELSGIINNRAHESFALQRTGFQAKLGRIHQGI